MEYWALVWGTIVMAVTGLMAWLKVPVGNLLPRWTIDVGLTVHFYEAILATLAILVWHFYMIIFDPDVYPAAALASLRMEPGSRVFTNDEWGDYLIYRGRKVFVDGRSDFYGDDFEGKYIDVLNVNYGWEKTLNGFAVDTILLPPTAPLTGALKESSGWRVVYDDGIALVFRSAQRAGGTQVSVAGNGGGRGVGIARPEGVARARQIADHDALSDEHDGDEHHEADGDAPVETAVPGQGPAGGRHGLSVRSKCGNRFRPVPQFSNNFPVKSIRETGGT